MTVKKLLYQSVLIVFLACLSWLTTSNSSQTDQHTSSTVSMIEAFSKDDSPLATFMTFQNQDAEEAMNFYVELFENSKVIEIQRYGKEGPGPEGSILVATFELKGSRFKCSDSFIKHEWDFTPGVSIWVDCTSDEEINTLFSRLSEKGSVLMPLGSYGFSQKFAFVEDRFGLSWQINLI